VLSSQLVADLKLDPQAVFVSGHSNGADLCYYLAIQPDTFVRAIAPMAGTMMVSWGKDFPKLKRISVMETHGTADDTTLYAGDMNDDYYGPYYGTETVVGDWAQWHQLE
jgi:poly(3-hydroxybutyrate) depolymerase